MQKIKMFNNLPELIKNGIRKRPDNTLSRNDCRVEPSNGNAPQTSTYNTTPNDCNKEEKRNQFSSPRQN